MSRLALLRSLRRLHRLMEQDPVEDGLRGWSWDRPPLRPRAYLGLGVSEVAYRYCPTMRDIYLRRSGVRVPASRAMENGSLIHAVFHAASEDVRRELVLGLRGWEAYEKLANGAGERLTGLGVDLGEKSWLMDLYKSLAMAWCSEERWGLFTEYRVDGSPLGLSRNLRADGLAEGGVVVEVKYGRPVGFHSLALAGYALALEADMEVPFDYGLLIYVRRVGDRSIVSWSPVYISPALRHDFIEARDEVMDMLLSDREPPRSTGCPETCPFREVRG